VAHTLKLCFSDASSGWRKSADVKRAGQRCAITGSDYLSEDAYAGGSESSPESYDDTDNYYVTAPFSRSRHCSATAELQQSLTTSASFSTHALSGSQLSGDDTNNVNSTSMVSSLVPSQFGQMDIRPKSMAIRLWIFGPTLEFRPKPNSLCRNAMAFRPFTFRLFGPS
jgi:hypothetical protein